MTDLLRLLDRARHKIPFWWWLTYDALVALVIVIGVKPSSPAFWIGLGTLAVAVLIDTVEFLVKSPWAQERLREKPPPRWTPETHPADLRTPK